MTTLRAPRRLLSAVAVAAVLAAACSSSPAPAPGARPSGGGREQPDPLARIATASERIDAAEAIAMDFTMVFSVDGQELGGSGSATAATDGSRMHMDMSYDSFPGLPNGFSMEMIVVDGVMYMSTDTFAAAGAPTGAFGGKDWVAIDLNDVVPGYESFADLGTGQNDPAQALEYLKGAGDVAVVGTEAIDGAETTHYRGTIDLEQVLSKLPADAQDEMRSTMDEFRRQFGEVTMPFDLWVDDQDRAVRMSFQMSSAAGSAHDFSMTMTVDITDDDADLGDVAAPPSKDVVDLAELAGSNV